MNGYTPKNMIKRLMKNPKNTLLGFLLAMVFTSYAQLYPVQLSPVINPPYSANLSDYATTLDEKIRLLVNPTDIGITNRQVRLKLYIQGNGITAESRPLVQGVNPIFINGGELITLTNNDFKALFRLENLQGLTAVQYANPLPEGMYSICFEVYDVITNQRLSQKSCTSIYLMLNDPPLLNTPTLNEQVSVAEFPNILFTWTPRQINATNVSYVFELKELQNPNIDPQFGFQMSPMLHQEDLYATSLLYDLSKPVLIPGKRYAWRVKAISTSGLSQNNVFKNDGYSEIFWFTYQSTCDAPSFVLSQVQTPSRVKVSWQGETNHTKYHVQYRKQNVPGAEWFSLYTLNTQAIITNLEAGEAYEFRVGASCDPINTPNLSFTYSGINQFVMPTEDATVNSEYNCGITPTINIENQVPLTNLIVGETFTAGDFPVTVMEVTGQGSYSGIGYTVVPYLADTKLAVVFDNIVINTDYQLIQGVVETSYNPNWDNVVSLDDAIADAQDAIDDLFNDEEEEEEEDGIAVNETEEPDDDGGDDGGENDDTTEDPVEDEETDDTGTDPGDDPQETDNGTEVADTNNDTSNDPDPVKEVFIEHNGKLYKDGDVIEVTYARNKPHAAFILKDYPENASINWEVLKLETDNTANYATNETTHDNLGIDMKSELELGVVANYNDEKIRVTIKRNRKEFDLIELYARPSDNNKRKAKSGQILYLVDNPDKRKVEYAIDIKPKLHRNRIYQQDLAWYYKTNNSQGDLGKHFGEKKIYRNLEYNKHKPLVNTRVKAGYTTALSKNVKVRWVEKSYDKTVVNLSSGNFSSETIKKVFEATKLVEKYGEKLEKLSFLKSEDKPVGITWYHEIIPFERIFQNIEAEDSRLYFSQKQTKGGFKAGLKGNVTVWKWGLPIDELPIPDWAKDKVKEYVVAEVKIEATADAGGEIKVVSEERKYAESEKWEEYKKSIDPAIIALNVAFGAKGEFSILKENDWFGISGQASGTAGAELLSIGFVGEEFVVKMLRKGVYLDLSASAYLKFNGFKFETTPYYERVQLIDPLDD